jgi:hypothetical protein
LPGEGNLATQISYTEGWPYPTTLIKTAQNIPDGPTYTVANICMVTALGAVLCARDHVRLVDNEAGDPVQDTFCRQDLYGDPGLAWNLSIGGDLGSVPLPGPARSVASTHGVGCAVLVDGRVACWGDTARWGVDLVNCVGSGATLIPELDNVVDLRSDSGGFVALLGDGQVVNFGNLVSDWAGWGGRELTLGPRRPSAMIWHRFDHRAVQIGSIEGISCALLANGQVHCWVQGAQATTLVPLLDDVEAIGQGNSDAHHMCAARADRTTWCWGNNHYGQVDGRTRGTAYPMPMEVDAWR